MNNFNTYNEKLRAESYARLEFPGTYFLAYRDLPEIIERHSVKGNTALDFGCGAGRSSRFISSLGYDVTGIDISAEMIRIANSIPAKCRFLHMENGNFSPLGNSKFDLITSIFTFDNIPGYENRKNILSGLVSRLNEGGVLINLVSSPDIYHYEWASFSTRDFPENKKASCGDIVKIINTDIDDKRPVDDLFWPNSSYLELFEDSGLILRDMYKPLGNENDPVKWINETEIAPWTIHVTEKSSH